MVNDPKEIAEHLMLIDLGRNDVGRIAELEALRLLKIWYRKIQSCHAHGLKCRS